MEETSRQKKYSKLVQKELSEIFQREYKVPGSQMITVSVVRTPPDLGMCKVYISILPDAALKTSVEYLNEHQWEVRHLLGQRIRHQVRHIPELHFYADDTQQYAARIHKILSDVRTDKRDEEE
jgi:ribosome-binding factor A